MSRWLAIVNPGAGAVRHRFLGQDFLDHLADRVADIAHTEEAGHARRIAAAAQEFDGLVAVGGDGTVAEVLSGMDRTRQHFAVIPGGTGNCLAVDLGLRHAPHALDAISHGRARPIDLMEVTLRHGSGASSTHHLASTAGMGYTTDVTLLAKRHFARLRGQAYSAAATFVRPRARNVRLAWNDNEAQPVRLAGMLINNTRHIGTVRSFPEARIDDGLLDVFLFQVGWLRQCLHNLQMVTGIPMWGTPQPHRARGLRLEFPEPETVMLDGDLAEDVVEMSVECRPAAVRCMGPAA